MRSAIEVAESASATPATSAARQLNRPVASASPAIAAAVSASCATPSPKMARRIAKRRDNSSSSPIRNSSITTPSSATVRMLSGVLNRRKPNGPMITPATR